jgi:hypothetical protein
MQNFIFNHVFGWRIVVLVRPAPAVLNTILQTPFQKLPMFRFHGESFRLLKTFKRTAAAHFQGPLMCNLSQLAALHNIFLHVVAQFCIFM